MTARPTPAGPTPAGPAALSLTALSAPRRSAGRLLVHLVLLVVALCFAAPFGWLLLASVDAHATASVRLPHPTAGNFSAVLTWTTSLRPILNSLLLCGGAAVVNMAVSVLAAYPLSRFQLRFKRPFLYTVLFATGLPVTAVMVPVYELFVRLELVDSLWGTMLFLATTTLPFSLWLTKGFMDGVPVSLEEAAWTDGASGLQSLRHVVLPLMAPGMAVVAVFTFIGAWGNFFIPFVLLQSPEKEPAAVGLYTFFGRYGTVAYGQLAAYSLLYSLPAVLLYVLVSRRMGRGFHLGGGLKG